MIAADKKQETLTLVVQAVGVSTAKIAALNSGEEIKDIVGPLGKPTLVQQYGTVVCVGSGIGIASLLPTISALKSENNHVIAVLMERENEPIILEQEIKAIADEVILSSNHGKDGEQGIYNRRSADDAICLRSNERTFYTYERGAQCYYG